MEPPVRLELSDEIIVSSKSLASHKGHFVQHYHYGFDFNLDDFTESDSNAI